MNISTGYDPVTNSILTYTGPPVGSNVLDPLWRLANLPPLTGTYPPSISVGQTYVVEPLNGSFACSSTGLPGKWNLTAASVISPRNQSQFAINNAFNVAPNSQPFRIVREFCVCDSTLATIDLNLRGDDAAQVSIYGPGISVGLIYQFNTAFPANPFPNNASNTDDFSCDHLDNQTITLLPGIHTIEIELLNNNRGYMGVSLDGSITAANGAQVLSHSTNRRCCRAGTIYAQKIIDSNCDGVFDVGRDTSHQGVTFNLLSGGIVVATSVTNAMGEVFFRNLPFGTYTIQEIVPVPYIPFAATSQTVTISGGNKSEFLSFYNCPPPMPNCCQDTLDIYNVAGTPNPLSSTQTTITGSAVTVASEEFEIHKDAVIPLLEMKVAITDIVFNYNYDACAECAGNPAKWGSLFSTDSTIGTTPNVLTLSPTLYQSVPPPNFVANNETWREIIWENKNGAMLKVGDTFNVSYILPPASEIPCCVTSVTICTEISWKDANCNICSINTCSNINIQI